MFDELMHKNNIENLLNQLSIKSNKKINDKGWLGILCPFHNDRNFGSCSININTGVISCFVCGSHHINEIIKARNLMIDVDFKEFDKIDEQPKQTISDRFDEKNNVYNFIYKLINPSEFYYTKQRGFTKDFCNTFQVAQCFTYPYEGYFTVLIKDIKKNIIAIEFRKLYEKEYLQKFFQDYESTFEILKNRLKEYINEWNIKFDGYNLWQKDNQLLFDENLKYLMKPKVLYEKNSALKETIWNIDNLNPEEKLYLVEGIGSIPKIWNKISTNVTCTFGSTITQSQIDYLKKFKMIVIIPDRDEAGRKMIETLYAQYSDLYVCDIEEEDTDTNYIKKILGTSNMKASDYLKKYFILGQWKK